MLAVHDIQAVLFANNAISTHLGLAALRHDGVDPARTVVFTIRRLNIPALRACGEYWDYGKPVSHSLLGQAKVAGFYWRAARRLRQVLKRSPLTQVYIVNNDNLLTNHVLSMARPGLPITVLAEGIMNYQDILPRNRAAWRWRVKALIAGLLGLRWSRRETHLSGSDDPEVARTISFSQDGLKAPADKVTVIPFDVVAPRRPPDPQAVLVPLTGLWRLMPEPEYLRLMDGFAAWLRGQGYRRILVKPHPHIGFDPLMDRLGPHEVVTDRRSLEDMAADIEAGAIAGTCCTGLATLRQVRPDLRCVDFGADYYCDHAYYGDHSVEVMLRGTGVEIVGLNDPAVAAPGRTLEHVG